jgi:hypothetical protein
MNQPVNLFGAALKKAAKKESKLFGVGVTVEVGSTYLS